MPRKRPTPPIAEVDCVIDVSVRLRMHGKPDKLREEARRMIERELGLRAPNVEIRRITVTKVPTK